jgi:hypothetical protein
VFRVGFGGCCGGGCDRRGEGDVAAVPAVVGDGCCLGGCFGVEAGCGAEVEVGWDWGVAGVEGVAFREGWRWIRRGQGCGGNGN